MKPRRESDRGGFLMMPLFQNIPDPKDDSWKLCRCPKCDKECWDRPLPEGFTEDMFGGKLCTMCALRAGRDLTLPLKFRRKNHD